MGFIMSNFKILFAVLIVMFSSAVFAGDSDALIELDKQWGSADSAESANFVSEDLVAIDPDGISGLAEMLAAPTDAAPSDTPYEAADYQVKFLSDDIAVMVHTATGDQPHSSMHVYQKQGDKWLVVATASSPKGK
jgi:hypothetical protein